MYQTLKAGYLKFHQSFRSSATIVLARVNVMAGSLWTVALAADPAVIRDVVPFLQNPKFFGYYLLANGFMTEYLRRRPRSEDVLPPVPATPTVAASLDPLK